MGSFDKLPKLMYKKYGREFAKRQKEDTLTSEDIDDWIEGLEWFLNTYKEFQESKQKKDI